VLINYPRRHPPARHQQQQPVDILDLNDAEKSLDKQQQLLDYIDDDILTGSKC
jgi:hypothetical protein